MHGNYVVSKFAHEIRNTKNRKEGWTERVKKEESCKQLHEGSVKNDDYITPNVFAQHSIA